MNYIIHLSGNFKVEVDRDMWLKLRKLGYIRYINYQWKAIVEDDLIQDALGEDTWEVQA